MRQKSLLSLALGLIVLGGACKKDEYRKGNPGTEGEVRFTSSIGAAVGTKMSGTTWDANDAIGVFMTQDADLTKALAANKKYTTNGNGNFTGEGADIIMYPESGKVDFVAYYPYVAGLNGVTLPVSVAEQSDHSKIDVLYSNSAKGLDASSGNAQLSFARKLTKVQLNIQAGDGVKTLDDLKVSFNGVNTESSLNLSTGVLAAGSEAKDVAALISKNGDKGTAEAILLPGDFAAKEVAFVADGKTYKWNIPAGTSFEAGKNNTYAIRLSLTETGDPTVDVVGDATITDWVDTPGKGTTLNPDGDAGEGDGDGDGGEGTNPGVVETIYSETFGPSIGKDTKYQIGDYTNYDEKDVVYTNMDPSNYTDVRATSSMDTHIWFPANRTTGLTIDKIKTSGHTKLKISYDLASGFANELYSGLTIKVNGVSFTPSSGTLVAGNKFETVILENVADAAELKLEFVANSANNTKGYRLDNIKIEGTTK